MTVLFKAQLGKMVWCFKGLVINKNALKDKELVELLREEQLDKLNRLNIEKDEQKKQAEREKIIQRLCKAQESKLIKSLKLL